MKVIHYILGGPKPNPKTGIGVVIDNLAKQQIHQGMEVEVWGTEESDFDYTGLDEFPYATKLFKATNAKFFISNDLKKAIKSLNPDNTIFHFHSVFIPEYYSIAIVLREHKVPWVTSPHGGYGSIKRNYMLKKVYSIFFENVITKNAQGIHTSNKHEADIIKDYMPWANTITIPYGQDFSLVSPGPEIPERPENVPIFGFCGRYDTVHKGLDLFLDGFAQYRKNGGKGLAWLIGKGEDQTDLEAQAKALNISDYIRFLGPIFGKKKYTYLIHVFDVFFHTSRWEGLPIALIEAASASCPLLVSKYTNIGHLVEKYNCGINIHENTPENIGKYLMEMEQLYVQGELTNMGANSLNMAKMEFDWRVSSKRMTQELYEPAFM